MARHSRRFRDRAKADISRRCEALFGIELLLLHISPVYFGMGVPRGDGSAVVLIPGFLGSDAYLTVMYAWLKRLGYRPYYSGILLNAECPNRLIRDRVGPILHQARRETAKKVHLIGHSLGGIIARSISGQRPQDVASVITLGSPFRGTVLHRSVLVASELVRKFILLKNGSSVLPHCYTGRCTCDFAAALHRALPGSVAQTAIYTPHDGVVDWRYCLTGNPDIDVEVSGTHAGLAFSPAVYGVIASRLAARNNLH